MNDNVKQQIPDPEYMDYYNTCRDDEDKCRMRNPLVEIHEMRGGSGMLK